MAAKMETTDYPGIFKRGGRYVVVYRVNGKQRKESARTLKAAIALKASRTTDRDRGELQADSRIPFEDFASEWIDRYMGNGRRGFSDATRKSYRRDLEHYAFPFLSKRLGRTVSQSHPPRPRPLDRVALR